MMTQNALAAMLAVPLFTLLALLAWALWSVAGIPATCLVA